MTDRLPHEKGFHVSWDQLHRDARALAWRLRVQDCCTFRWIFRYITMMVARIFGPRVIGFLKVPSAIGIVRIMRAGCNR